MTRCNFIGPYDTVWLCQALPRDLEAAGLLPTTLLDLDCARKKGVVSPFVEPYSLAPRGHMKHMLLTALCSRCGGAVVVDKQSDCHQVVVAQVK